ncbi:MAG TPA: dienelactone hydrolase family protein [Vicinamibacterales bacterium]|nr:dienelactone hydrolase family protein [Vicinamibacterales bacterium]
MIHNLGMRRLSLLLIILSAIPVFAQNNRIDVVTPSAPELAAYGPYAIGVRSIAVVDRNRPDILNTTNGQPTARSDRTLVLETWYPAALADNQKPGGDYLVITRDPAITATLHGKAIRDAAPLKTGAPFPLVIISHGYPGNRFLMSHIGENLASKGFVTVAIDHRDSTYDDQKAFASTLYNRPFDQLFVLNEIDRLSKRDATHYLNGVVDASRTAIIGYSMGGYGVVNVIGGGYSAASSTFPAAPPNQLLAERGAANPRYQSARDPRIKAAIAIGPWGMQGGYWDADGLAGIRTPVMFVAGSVDDVSGYEKGVRAMYTQAINADRYLLTFINANHNAAAPIPAPAEVYGPSTVNAFGHYADPVWDTVRMNNIFNHFATAFLSVHLKADVEKQQYLDVVPHGKDGLYNVDRDGNPTGKHTYWKGFKRGTAVGLILERAAPGH